MAERRGDVAFVKHTTVGEVVAKGGHGKVSDYQYLCKDNTRKGKQETGRCSQTSLKQFSARTSGACEIVFAENGLQFVNSIFTQGGIKADGLW